MCTRDWEVGAGRSRQEDGCCLLASWPSQTTVSFRFSEKPCLKAIKHKAVEPPTSSDLNIYVPGHMRVYICHTCTHVPSQPGLYSETLSQINSLVPLVDLFPDSAPETGMTEARSGPSGRLTQSTLRANSGVPALRLSL